jgi:ferritin
MKSLLATQDKKRLDEAAQRELTAQNMYRYLSNCVQSKGFFGCQKYFLAEAKDEGKHYQEIAEFVNARGAETEVLEVPEQDFEAKTLKDAFTIAFDAEVKLGEFYEKFYKETSDVTLQQFLLKYIERQRVAVGEYFDFLATLEICGSEAGALLMFDASFKG